MKTSAFALCHVSVSCVMDHVMWLLSEKRVIDIDIGGGPSGPSIEGPFFHSVHLCRTLGERKVEKKSKKKIKKKEGKIEKREK